MGVRRGFRKAFKTFVDPDDVSPPEAGSGVESLALAPPPERADWRADGILSPVRDQGNCNTCTSFAGVAVIEAAYRIRTRQSVRLAPSFIHRCLLARDCHTGASAKQVLSAVAARGVARGFVGDDPFPQNRCATRDLFGLQSWGWLEGTDTVLATIAADGPVLADMFIEDSFLSLRSNKIYQLPAGRPSVLHSVVIVGYDRPAGWVLVQNSFGAGWGDDGFGQVAIGSGDLLSGRGAFKVAA